MLRNRLRNPNESKSRLPIEVIASIIGVVLGTSACGTPNGANAVASTSSTSVQIAVYQAAAKFSGPITTGHVIEPLTAISTDLAAHGYEEQEFFASGTADGPSCPQRRPFTEQGSWCADRQIRRTSMAPWWSNG
jgi:hypothetical protein